MNIVTVDILTTLATLSLDEITLEQAQQVTNELLEQDEDNELPVGVARFGSAI